MNNKAEILSNTDATRFKRVIMIGRYFSPILKTKIWVFPLVALVVMACADALGLEQLNPAALTELSLLSWLIVFSPLMFAKSRADEMFYTLPALGWEKCEFVFLWSFIAVPAMVLVPCEIYALIFMPGFELNADAFSAMTGSASRTDRSALLLASSLLSTFSAIAAGLAASFGARNHRTLKAVAAILGTVMIDGLFGFVAGFAAAITGNADSIPSAVGQTLDSYGAMLAGFWLIFFIVAITLAARAIARKQV